MLARKIVPPWALAFGPSARIKEYGYFVVMCILSLLPIQNVEQIIYFYFCYFDICNV
jgi:hypothetical protein